MCIEGQIPTDSKGRPYVAYVDDDGETKMIPVMFYEVLEQVRLMPPTQDTVDKIRDLINKVTQLYEDRFSERPQ